MKHIPQYTNGILTGITGLKMSDLDTRDYTYSASTIISDGVTFDLTKTESIKSIPVPRFPKLHGMPNITEMLDYDLRMVAWEIRTSGDHNLSLICLSKAQDMMELSPVAWQYRDFRRLPEWLEEDGFGALAERLDLYYKSHYPQSQPLNAIQSEQQRFWEESYLDYRKRKVEYERLRREYPDLIPSKMASWTRMKNANTKKYQEIMHAIGQSS